MARFQSASRVPLFIVMSSSLARYGLMASPFSFSISPEIPSGPIYLLFPIAPTLFPMILVSMVKSTPELRALCMLDVTLAAEYRRIIVIKRTSLLYRICNEPTITVFDSRNIFPLSFPPVYVISYSILCH